MAIQSPKTFSIRQFRPDEAALYRSIRLEALATEPGFFGNPQALEAAFPPGHWTETLRNPLRACFGLFAGEELIGLTSVFCTAEKPREGYLTQSFIRKPFRGMGLSSMLYRARIDWAVSAGLDSLLVGHRASNVVSKAANQRHGFRFSHSEHRHWPDGGEEEMLYYRLQLHTLKSIIQ